MPSIADSLSETFLIALMIKGLQILSLQIFYVQMSQCKSGMDWGGSGLILESQNLWPWVESLLMDVKFKIFVLLVTESCFDLNWWRQQRRNMYMHRIMIKDCHMNSRFSDF